jgi:hypothetical protein
VIGAVVMVARIATGESQHVAGRCGGGALVEASEPKPGKRGPYRKRVAA